MSEADEKRLARIQGHYRRLARKLRAHLDAAATLLGTTPPEGLKAFAEACRESYWFSVNAELFVKNVEDELRKLYCDH